MKQACSITESLFAARYAQRILRTRDARRTRTRTR